VPIQEAESIDQDGEKVAEVKHRVERGEYRVEPAAVADALLRRLRELAQARAEPVHPQEGPGRPISFSDRMLVSRKLALSVVENHPGLTLEDPADPGQANRDGAA
jgi:hypothetical protein